MTEPTFYQDPLWQAIEAFPLDKPDAAHPFSAKLAREQQWNPEKTEKAIAEYKRFIYLCCISPHGASPPPDIDEVWHLHLTYTTDYWHHFCRNTLKRDIHHHPSSGGETENEKHHNWYTDTLLLYEHTFGQLPPPDLWPPPAKKLPPVHVNTARFYKSSFSSAIILLLPFAGMLHFTGYINPFRLAGPQFIQFYLALIIAAFASLSLSARFVTNILDNIITQTIPALTYWQLAWLAGGNKRYKLIAINHLINQQSLIYFRTTYSTSSYIAIRDSANLQNPMRPALYYADDEQHLISLKTLWAYTPPDLSATARHFLPLQNAINKSGIFLLPFLTTIFTGIARCIQGASNNRPIAILLILLIFFAAFYLSIVKQNSFHALMNKILQRHLPYEPAMAGYNVPVLLAGVTAIAADVPTEALATWYRTNYPHSEPGGCGSSSSCGSGDGGGCGGGCGGCGGD
jgi:uncharacterized membrane protein YgcG